MAPIRKLLIANRGEIAGRIMATCRDMGIATVAVFSDPDRGAPFVSLADEAVHLAGSAPGDTYLNIDRIIAAAVSVGADAVHPGYGFLSENAGFARACMAAGLIFVGPPAAAIEAMGSKPAAKALMAEAGVPVLPGITIDATVDVAAAAARTGWPVLVKAAYGGGGRGMRIARSVGELESAVVSAEREAASAFGDGTVFLERFVESPRHIEVQIFGDSHGNVIHLFERECSIQRRYQKIIEESPAPTLNDTQRDELGAAAVTAAKALGYVGAGTVEFVVAPDGAFFFLEVNTRLQVEHPVTEAVTGLDLVRLQLLVAQGEPLPVEALDAVTRGHAIEARLYAEDVSAGFLPASGAIHRLHIPAGPGLRVDAGYTDGSVVSTFYDAMLAKVIAWAPTRLEAASLLAGSLARARLHGVTTNRDLLVGILRDPEFLAGATDTGFLERHDPVALSISATAPPTEVRVWHAMAAALTSQAARNRERGVQPAVPPGWRNVVTGPERVVYNDGEVEVGYRTGRAGMSVSVDNEPLDGLRVWSLTPEFLDATVAGVRRRVEVQRVGATCYVDSDLGSSALVEVDRFPLPQSAAATGSLLAPMPGSVVRVQAVAGAGVQAGETLVVLEAMKMEHAIRAPHAGTVASVGVVVGQQVETGTVLVVVDAAPPTWKDGEEMAVMLAQVCADLGAETADLATMLAPLDEPGWDAPTPAPGWSIRDQVSHLAYFDDVSTLAATNPEQFRVERDKDLADVDGMVDRVTLAHRHLSGAEALAWLQRARAGFIDAVIDLDPGMRVPWYGPDMTLASSVTSRIMETWAHGQDIADTIGVSRPATDRLRHIAFLGARAVPNSYRARGLEVPDVGIRIELTGPGGDEWSYGPEEATDVVRGAALDFCLVVTQRRHPADTALTAQGPVATEWLSIAQAFAGPPGAGRRPGEFAGDGQ